MKHANARVNDLLTTRKAKPIIANPKEKVLKTNSLTNKKMGWCAKLNPIVDKPKAETSCLIDLAGDGGDTRIWVQQITNPYILTAILLASVNLLWFGINVLFPLQLDLSLAQLSPSLFHIPMYLAITLIQTRISRTGQVYQPQPPLISIPQG